MGKIYGCGRHNQNKANADIRDALAKKGIQHYEFAKVLGISKWTLWNWLKDENLAENIREFMLAQIRRM